MSKVHEILVLAALLWSSCTSSALPGLTPVRVESKRSTPAQLCRATPEFQRAVDLALVVLVDELIAANLLPGRSEVARSLEGRRPIACWIDQPERCALTPKPCEDPRSAPARCARKRGCGHDSGLWVARLWPPVCSPDWPEEPRCAADASSQSADGWESDLIHELTEMLFARFGGKEDAHAPAALEAQRRAFARYQEARDP